jgi:2-polyprenyl-6-methoxyphenol hydroxylase-like FAD-dependent oxidoreductase
MGGIGINLAIQDAVSAANLLAGRAAGGRPVNDRLWRVQHRRYASTALVQAVQRIAQNWVLAPLLQSAEPLKQPPWPLRLLDAAPLLRRIPGRAIAMGVKQERVAFA